MENRTSMSQRERDDAEGRERCSRISELPGTYLKSSQNEPREQSQLTTPATSSEFSISAFISVISPIRTIPELMLPRFPSSAKLTWIHRAAPLILTL